MIARRYLPNIACISKDLKYISEDKKYDIRPLSKTTVIYRLIHQLDLSSGIHKKKIRFQLCSKICNFKWQNLPGYALLLSHGCQLWPYSIMCCTLLWAFVDIYPIFFYDIECILLLDNSDKFNFHLVQGTFLAYFDLFSVI